MLLNTDIPTSNSMLMIDVYKRQVVGYHGIQSFKTGEVTPEQAFEIGKATARKMWGDRYQAVSYTHLIRKILICMVTLKLKIRQARKKLLYTNHRIF